MTVIFLLPDLSLTLIIQICQSIERYNCTVPFMQSTEKSGLVSIHEAASQVIGIHPCVHNTTALVSIDKKSFRL